MALKYLYTGHNYSNVSATFEAQWLTQTDEAILSTVAFGDVYAGRFSNTAFAAALDSPSYTTGPYYTKAFLLENDKKVFIAIDYSVFVASITYTSKYVLALSNGTLAGSMSNSPEIESNNANFYYTLLVTSAGYLQLRNSVGGILATGNIYLGNNVFYRITVESTIAISGQIKVYVNDELDINFTGDTTNNITTNQYRMRYGFVSAKYGTIALWDTSNNVNTGFTGYVNDFEPIQLLPDGAGSTTQGTPFGQANNWQCVDETFRNGTTDYVVLAANTTQKDLYSYSNVSVIGNVISVATIPAAWLSNLGNINLARISFEASSNGSNANSVLSPPLSPVASSTTTYGLAIGVLELATDPNTGNSWTTDAIDNAQFGFSAK